MVFLNGKMAYVDKNLYGEPIMKEPKGRCSVENASFVLHFREGNNELVIGVANSFYGWGVVARLENVEGLKIAPDPTFDSRMVKLSDTILDIYAGTYVQPNGKTITVAREKNAIKFSGEGMPTHILYPQAENKFFLKDFDVQMEFVKDDADKVVSMLIYENGKQVMDVKRAN